MYPSSVLYKIPAGRTNHNFAILNKKNRRSFGQFNFFNSSYVRVRYSREKNNGSVYNSKAVLNIVTKLFNLGVIPVQTMIDVDLLYKL